MENVILSVYGACNGYTRLAVVCVTFPLWTQNIFI